MLGNACSSGTGADTSHRASTTSGVAPSAPTTATAVDASETSAFLEQVASALELEPGREYPGYETVEDRTGRISVDVPAEWDDRILDGGPLPAALVAATEVTDAASTIVPPTRAPSGVSIQIRDQGASGDIGSSLGALEGVDSCSIMPEATNLISSSTVTLDAGEVPAFIFATCDDSGAGVVVLLKSSADRQSYLQVVLHLNEAADLAAVGHVLDSLEVAADTAPLDEAYFSPCWFEGDPLDVEPDQVVLGCDGATLLTDLRWDDWSSSGASGSGTYSSTDCVPNCASGTASSYAVDVELSAPQELACGRFFTAAVLRFPGDAPATAVGSEIDFGSGQLAPVC